MSATLIRVAHDYATVNGYASGMPNFHQANYGCGVVRGIHLIKSGFAEWRDVPAAEFGDIDFNDVSARIRAAHDYAVRNGYVFGMPTFHQADYGSGTVFGTILFNSNTCEWRDVPAAEFGNIDFNDVSARIRAAHDYAVRNGYAFGMPNFHQADYGSGVVFGTVLFRHVATEWRDVLDVALSIFDNFTFDDAITVAQRATLLERHAFAIHRVCSCGHLTAQEREQLMNTYTRNIWHGIDNTPGVNARAILGGNQIWVNFNVLFPQGNNEIAQTLIHEMMHCAGYSHPARRDPSTGQSCNNPDPDLFDCPFDNGPYYGTAPLRAEICIAGNQSDRSRVDMKAVHEHCSIDPSGSCVLHSGT